MGEDMDKNPRGRTATERFTTIDGRLVDSHGEIVPGTSGWAQHPQSGRPSRRLQPMPNRPQDAQHPNHGQAYDQYGQPYQMPPAQPSVNVTVSNDGQYYRPWKDELKISAGRSIGNFIAAPFLLVWGLLGAALRMALMFVIVPAMIFGAIAFYQSHQDKSGNEMAHDIGKAGVGLVGSAFSGIWDGFFGDDEPTQKEKAVDEGDKGAKEPAEPKK
jgi:hypothetical protein